MELEAYKVQREYLLENCDNVSIKCEYETFRMLELVQDSIEVIEKMFNLSRTEYKMCKDWYRKYAPKY